ncbi:hypothetical protein TNCT_572361 [Trichonephila clavata]|uniref:Uncharacterized protein n=1 Tax=Trichonephila clavata TaxID=2740835 RepID=A0A8X6GA02_TRICU|nr:hypothetical protein TNCT_572361 [Trichonephila clavata]
MDINFPYCVGETQQKDNGGQEFTIPFTPAFCPRRKTNHTHKIEDAEIVCFTCFGCLRGMRFWAGMALLQRRLLRR